MFIGSLIAVVLIFAVPAFFSTQSGPEPLVWAGVAAAFPFSLVALILINIKGTLRERLKTVLAEIGKFEESLQAKLNTEQATDEYDLEQESTSVIQTHIEGVKAIKERLGTNYRLERYRGSFVFIAAVYSFLFFFAFNKILAISSFGNLQSTLISFPDTATAALFGAWAYALYSVISRISTADLSPEFLLRLAYQPVIAIAFAFFATFMFAQDFLLLISFGIGFLPYPEIVRFIRVRTQQRLSKSPGADSSATADADIGHAELSEIDGIDFDEIDRLHEENIKNIQQLAFSSPLEIHFSTAYPLKTIIDWIDQALLRLYLNKPQWQALKPIGIRGAIEMAQVLRRIREYERKRRKARDEGDIDTAKKADAAAKALITDITTALGAQTSNVEYLAYQLREDPHVQFVYFLYDELASSS